MTKLLAILFLLLTASAPAPEIIAKPVPFNHEDIEESFQAPLRPKGPGHRGIDLAIDATTAISSPFDGEIFFAGKVFNRQVVTVVSNSGLKASFEPVCALLQRGSSVLAGQKIGLLCTPETDYEMHCESCVHFSIRNEYGYLNPLLFYGMLSAPVLTR